MPELPKLSIDPEQLQSIQQQYLTDATDLWRRGFGARPEGDKRFAAEAWGSNPMAAFSAAVYLLNVVDGCIPSDLATGRAAEIEE